MGNKARTSLSMDQDMIDKADRLVEKGLYRNRSHAFEEGLKKILAEQNI